MDVDAKVREANPLARLSQLNDVYGDVADRLLRDTDAKTGRFSGETKTPRQLEGAAL